MCVCINIAEKETHSRENKLTNLTITTTTPQSQASQKI